jgi:hypothetical protein
MISKSGAMAESEDMSTVRAKVDIGATADKVLPPAAKRALAEAAARRAEMESHLAAMPREIGGRGGKEPVRYGDWEVKGIASDF